MCSSKASADRCMLLALLSPQDAIVACALLVLVYGLARLANRKVTLGFGKTSITIEDVHNKVEEIQQTVGVKNGGTDVVHQLEELDAKVTAVDQRLDQRTHVTRAGATEPEELAPYAQDWFHEINGQLTSLIGHIWLIQQALREQGINVPDLPPPPDLIDLSKEEK